MEAPPASAEETQRRVDYLASDEFKRERAASLAGRNPAAGETDVRYDADGDRFVRAFLCEREKARADAAEAKCAQMQEGAAGLLDDLAAANARAEKAEAESLKIAEDSIRVAFEHKEALAAARRECDRWVALHDGHAIDCEEAAHRRECICTAALAAPVSPEEKSNGRAEAMPACGARVNCADSVIPCRLPLRHEGACE